MNSPSSGLLSRLGRLVAVLLPIVLGFLSTALALVLSGPLTLPDVPVLGLVVLVSPGLGFHPFLVLSLVLAVLSGFKISTGHLRLYSYGSSATLLLVHVFLLLPLLLGNHITPIGWLQLLAGLEPLLPRLFALPFGFLVGWYLTFLIPAVRAYRRGAPNPSLQRTRYARR